MTVATVMVRRRSRRAALLGMVALALAVAACSPAPVPSTSAPATGPSATVTAPPSAQATDRPSAPAVVIAPAPTPARTPYPLHGYRLVLDGPPEGGVELSIRDWSGALAGAGPADPRLANLPEPGPRRLAIGPGSSERRVTVAWTGGVCDRWLLLDVAADGGTLTLHEPPGPGCDAMGIGRSVELHFEGAVDHAAFTGSISVDAIAVDAINPTIVAFADPLHGWVAGTIERGEAVIEETRDGGATWTVTSLGAGTVTGIAVAGDRAVAGRLCPETTPDCGPGLFRQDGDGDWSAEANDRPLALDFAGRDGIGAFLVPGRASQTGMPIPEVRVTDDGFNWVSIDNPCGRMHLVDVAMGPDAMPLALCTSEGGGGGQRKAIYRANRGGGAWEVITTTQGGLPISGTGVRFDVSDDGSGWMWGARTPLLATADGGITWHAVAGPADGDLATSVGASAVEGGAGYQLVVSRDRDATTLSWTPDGVTWQERFAWPIHAVCCG